MKKEKAKEIFKNFLKEGKNRNTPERYEVLEHALKYQGHFGADDLFISMKNFNSIISRATIYNTLELLVQCGLLSKRNFGDNITRYENNFKRKQHDHIICMECGKIIEFSDPKISKISEKVCNKYGYELDSFSFNIFARFKNKSYCVKL